jgi:hypothetical protein
LAPLLADGGLHQLVERVESATSLQVFSLRGRVDVPQTLTLCL